MQTLRKTIMLWHWSGTGATWNGKIAGIFARKDGLTVRRYV
jgi:hypothetical protein